MEWGRCLSDKDMASKRPTVGGFAGSAALVLAQLYSLYTVFFLLWWRSHPTWTEERSLFNRLLLVRPTRPKKLGSTIVGLFFIYCQTCVWLSVIKSSGFKVSPASVVNFVSISIHGRLNCMIGFISWSFVWGVKKNAIHSVEAITVIRVQRSVFCLAMHE